MPWYNASTGEHVYSPSDADKQKDELVYKPSIYAKEELPTWSEVYEEFYLGKQYSYDPNNPDDQTIDPYWKIPHKKFLIATVCNQFNKMIFEDGLKDEILSDLEGKLSMKVYGIQFVYGTSKYMTTRVYSDIKFIKNPFITPADIYTIPMPTGKLNPFIISKHRRVDITKVKDSIFSFTNDEVDSIVSIYPVIQIYSFDTLSNTIYTPEIGSEQFDIVMSIMMERFKEYFTGDIGWKDSEGKLIEGDPGSRNCTGAGYETR